MNTLKITPLLAVFLVLLMAAPAAAQTSVNVEVNVGASKDKAQKKRNKKKRRERSRRDKRRSSRHSDRSRRDHQSSNHTVVHEHIIVHEHVHTQQPEPEPQYYPMEDAKFAQLLAQIENEPFSSGKLSIISMAVDYNYFTSGQTRQVVSALTFSSDKIEAAVLMHPMVLDPESFYQVFTAFTFESSKTEVRARLGI